MTTKCMSLIAVGAFFMSVGCGASGVTDTEDTSPTDTDTDTDTDMNDTGTLQEGDVQALSGMILWTVDFDAVAEELGFTDCSYRREYSGIEDKSQPWLCPECIKVFRVEATVVDGLEDCYKQIASEPSPTEWLGWTEEGVFRRAGRENYLLSVQGDAVVGENVVTTQHAATVEMPDGGQFTFDIQGNLDRSIGQGDEFHGYTAPTEYACGWPKSGLPEFTGEYALRVGGTLPDAHLMDRCDEPVRLHDFAGRYLVVDVSAVNCPPCRVMAQQEPAFAEKMKADGIDVEMVTLMAPSLSEVLTPTSVDILMAWTEEYALTGPVLADRGYGYWLGKDALENFAYPTWILVSPDLTVFEMGTGFSSFDSIEASIRAHSASR